MPETNSSNHTRVLSFHLPGPPLVVNIIIRLWFTVAFNVLVVELHLLPMWLCLIFYSHFSVVTCFQSVDPIPPDNPTIINLVMWYIASSKLLGLLMAYRLCKGCVPTKVNEIVEEHMMHLSQHCGCLLKGCQTSNLSQYIKNHNVPSTINSISDDCLPAASQRVHLHKISYAATNPQH